MVVCQGCGTENPPDAAYCSKCARKLDQATQAAVVRRRAEHTATGVRWAAVMAAVILVLVIALVVALVLSHAL